MEFVSQLEHGIDSRLEDFDESQAVSASAWPSPAPSAEPDILILDEATQCLFVLPEALIHDALAGIIKDKITFVIAHRLSTVDLADRIMVVKAGSACSRMLKVDAGLPGVPASGGGAQRQRKARPTLVGSKRGRGEARQLASPRLGGARPALQPAVQGSGASLAAAARAAASRSQQATPETTKRGLPRAATLGSPRSGRPAS